MVDPKDCLFCRIVKGQLPAKKVYEDAQIIAFLDISPRNPGHTLVIPKKHVETLFDFPDADSGRFFYSLKRVAIQVKTGMQAQGLSIAQNNGSAAGQVVAHLHFHLIPRFLNEGPPALESILPIKKMDDQSMEKVASAIQGAAGSQPAPRRDSALREEPTPPPKQKSQKLIARKPEKKPEPPKEEQEDDTDELEEIDFSL